MFSIPQLIRAIRKLQANGGSGGDLAKTLKYAAVADNSSHNQQSKTAASAPMASPTTAHDMLMMTSSSSTLSSTLTQTQTTTSPEQQQQTIAASQQHIEVTNSYENQASQRNSSTQLSTNVDGSLFSLLEASGSQAQTTVATQERKNTAATQITTITTTRKTKTTITTPTHFCNRSQQIQNFYQQQLHQFHTQHNQSRYAKQKQTQFAMSSLAAEPLSLKTDDVIANGSDGKLNDSEADKPTTASSSASSATSGKPCLTAGFAEMLMFMELIGNLKHTKRTGWVLRDVNDCESISGHMYRMSMMTFLLDGTEGLNQIRCMELALVHDLAESLVGDITPFCGISKEDKRAMEFKAMEDICKLIEPRGKRIMDLFEEYENGESAESRFVKDLDRLDMVMQAFEYEKRDKCLLKHQEFFDSTAGKFNHPFVKKLVNEIYEQRKQLAKATGATPPPQVVVVPNWDLPNHSNGHSAKTQQQQQQQGEESTKTSTS